MPAPSLLDAQLASANNAIRTPYGVTLPPGARVAAYVRSTGVQSGDDAFLATNLVTTLAAGLARARPGMGDFVVCLPGHVESVVDGTTFSNALVAGTKIIGIGRGANTPTFTWSTVVTARWNVAVADVAIVGLRLQLDGINTVTNAINVTGADFGFFGNDVRVSQAGAAVATAITVAAGGDRCDISGNNFRGLASVSPSANLIVYSGITDGCRFCDNEWTCPGLVGSQISVTAACTNMKILRNVLNHITAASVTVLIFSNLAITGQCSYNTICVLNGGVVVDGTTGIAVGGTNNLMGFFQNFVVNNANKSGLLLPTVDT